MEVIFEEKFPSLKGKGYHNIDIVLGDELLVKRTSVYEDDDLNRYCLDKQRVKELWDELMDKTDSLHDLECGSCDEEVKQFVKELMLE